MRDILSVNADAAATDACGLRQQTSRRFGDHGFTAAGFAHQALIIAGHHRNARAMLLRQAFEGIRELGIFDHVYFFHHQYQF